MEKLAAPQDVFHALYHHFLCLADPALHAPSAAAAPCGSSGQLAALVQGDAEADRQLCARAMAAVYHAHAGLIGALQGFSS